MNYCTYTDHVYILAQGVYTTGNVYMYLLDILCFIGNNTHFPAAKLGELQSAVQSFERSLELAKLLEDEPSQVAVKKALEEINSQIVQELSPEEDKGESEETPDS